MNRGRDKKMEDIMEESPYDMGYGANGRDVGDFKAYHNRMHRTRSLLLGGAGIVVLIILVVIFFRSGSSINQEDLASIHARLDRVRERLERLDRVENRIVLLEKHEKALRESISKLESSGRLLRRQLDKVARGLEGSQKGMALKAQKPIPGHEKAVSGAKGRYHIVGRGDTLYAIAKKYKISINKLCRLNRISRKEIIRPGQRLLISQGARH